ncbi:hypothetical protein LINPERPRIM_LOCUS3183 [Linum perenne]
MRYTPVLTTSCCKTQSMESRSFNLDFLQLVAIGDSECLQVGNIRRRQLELTQIVNRSDF